MSANFKRRLPIPQDLKKEMPLSEESAARKKEVDAEVASIIRGESDKKLIIVGPCSADNEDAVLDYAHRLSVLQECVQDKLVIVMRVYTNKPRTNGTGYKGLLHQPNPEAAPDLLEGLKAIRHMHLRVIEETGLFTADEMLYPENDRFLNDLLAYVAVGARSVENQQHRLTSSGVDIPVGMKNGTSGDISIMFNAIKAAQSGHDFVYRRYEVSSSGNPYAHAVLRGGSDSMGRSIPNYHFEDLQYIAQKYQDLNLKNPAIIIDTNHSNSGKKYDQQPRIASEVLHSMNYDPLLKNMIKGFMIESYIEPGNQKIGDNLIYGKSITDPCLGCRETEKMIYDIADKL